MSIEHFDVLIVGAGLSGIGAAVQLKKNCPERSFAILEGRESLGGTWGFTPLSNGEIEKVSEGLQHLIVPEMTAVAEVDGRPVASAFGLLDYNPLIKKIDGRLYPFGFLRLLWGRKKIQRVRLISTNVEGSTYCANS